MIDDRRMRMLPVGGVNYQIRVMNVNDGIRVGGELLRILLPVIAAKMDDDLNELKQLSENTLFSEIAAIIVHNLNEEKIIESIGLLFKDAYRGSHALDYNEDLAGDYALFAVLLEFALRENFSGFFSQYFKARGLKIPSLEEIMTARSVSTPEESTD